jgi:hypothetical protein
MEGTFIAALPTEVTYIIIKNLTSSIEDIRCLLLTNKIARYQALEVVKKNGIDKVQSNNYFKWFLYEFVDICFDFFNMSTVFSIVNRESSDTYILSPLPNIIIEIRFYFHLSGGKYYRYCNVKLENATHVHNYTFTPFTEVANYYVGHFILLLNVVRTSMP